MMSRHLGYEEVHRGGICTCLHYTLSGWPADIGSFFETPSSRYTLSRVLLGDGDGVLACDAL
jgi:hypothetical protein